MKSFKAYENKDEFTPHMMYDPKTKKGYKAKTYDDHMRMKKMGYKHWDKGVPPNHPFWKIEQTIRVPLNESKGF